MICRLKRYISCVIIIIIITDTDTASYLLKYKCTLRSQEQAVYIVYASPLPTLPPDSATLYLILVHVAATNIFSFKLSEVCHKSAPYFNAITNTKNTFMQITVYYRIVNQLS